MIAHKSISSFSPSARAALLIYGVLPVAYIASGRLGLLLAIPPGYATAVFLPAGIAIAAALMGGLPSVPGTVIASFLLNAWIGYDAGHSLDATRIASAAAIAFASALQAGIGGAVLRRAIGYPAPLDNPRDILCFLLLSPLICLTSATISVGSLWALAVLPPAELGANWRTWWVGDTLGALVAAPLMLVLVGRPRALWRLRFWYVAVPMMLCFALFVAIFLRVRSWEERQSLIAFEMRSQQLPDAMHAALTEQSVFLWMVLAGGVLCTGLLGAFLMLGTGYAYRMRVKEQELETIVNRTPFMLTRCGRDLRYRFISRSYGDMIGRRPEDVAGKPIVDIMGEEGFQSILPHVRKVLQGERVEYESEVHFRGIGNRFLRVAYTPERNEWGKVESWIASIVDVTERRLAESQRDVLVAEVNHRVKNTLASVISIAYQSFKRSGTFEAALASFDRRIRALAQAHTRLAEASWSGVALRTIVEDETAPYRSDDNVRIAGPDITLKPKAALSLGMALHELATNAAKYGALCGRGSVEAAWRVEPAGSEVRLTWVESGGPRVTPPQRSGFGRLLLERVLASDLNGTVALDFRAEGLRCTITFPLDRQVVSEAELAAGRFAPPADDAPPAPQPEPRRDRLVGAHILLVEDEALLALELEQILGAAGATVIGPFADLAGARQRARDEAIDIAILDTNLNSEMVYPLAEELLARGVPFLFVTGYDVSDLPERFRAIRRVSKPFNREDLIRQVRATLDMSHGGIERAEPSLAVKA